MNDRELMGKIAPLTGGDSEGYSSAVHNEYSLPMERGFVERRKTHAQEQYGSAQKVVMRINKMEKMVLGLRSLIVEEKERSGDGEDLQKCLERVEQSMHAIEALKVRARERNNITRKIQNLEKHLREERDANNEHRHTRERHYLSQIAQFREQLSAYRDVDEVVENIAAESEACKDVVESALLPRERAEGVDAQEGAGGGVGGEHYEKLHPRFYARYGEIATRKIEQYAEVVEELEEYIKQLQEYGGDVDVEQALRRFLLRARQRLVLAKELHEVEIAVRNAVIAGDDQESIVRERDQLRERLEAYDALDGEIDDYFRS